MPRTRSRPKTEEKFQNAVLELVASDGCGALGINAVAQLAGADKVLIYRYFGDFNGLLSQVANSRQWLPTAEEVYCALPDDMNSALVILREVETLLLHHVRSDATTLKLVRWRHASACPLCRQYSDQWHSLWKSLPKLLAANLPAEQRTQMIRICEILALLIESQLCDQSVDRNCLEQITQTLDDIQIRNESVNRVMQEDSLPTNLL